MVLLAGSISAAAPAAAVATVATVATVDAPAAAVATVATVDAPATVDAVKVSAAGSLQRQPKAFPVGSSGRRALKKALVKSTEPANTITSYQQAHSVHSMMAQAFGTTPRQEKSSDNTEALDTDSALVFLSHLGVSQYEVHKRIADALRNQLEDEVRSLRGAEEPLLNLLKSCWAYATSSPELRPILWAVLKQLGPQTPLSVLERLAERDNKTGELRYAEVWPPLTPLLKRLVWEADWDKYVPNESQAMEIEAKKFLSMTDSTLLGKKIQPFVDEYCNQEALITAADQIFVASIRQRRIATSQRRALSTTNTSVTAPNTSRTLQQLSQNRNITSEVPLDLTGSGRAVSKIRQVMGGSIGETATGLSYRPKLLYAVLSMLMARHGQQDTKELGGASHLHCTLVADLLLSAGGPLPKPYQHVLSLARVLDESVKTGDLTSSAVANVQQCLRSIFQAEPSTTSEVMGNPSRVPEKIKTSKQEHTDFMKRLLKRIITEALSAMKKTDPQSLFLNPVSDAIAPGYSAVIKKPMCIKAMESKIEASNYSSLGEWENDVQLIFRNCIAYNIGNDGQWFRGEARRQNKILKDNILPQARKMYNNEMAKRSKALEEERPKRKLTAMDGDRKGEQGLTSNDVEPLPPSKSKKRKKDNQENIPSVPAIASMVLADPFVVRLLVDRILRSIRIDLLRGTTLPVAHRIVPSLLQLLNIAQASTQVCANRGKRYFVPDAGLTPTSNRGEQNDNSGSNAIPFSSLRKITPLLMRLMLESELDRRMAIGGDLSLVSHTSANRPTAPSDHYWSQASHLHALRVLTEGALVHWCQPNLNDASLALTFPRFATVLQKLSTNLWHERPFFVSLIQALIKHKSKLGRATRDVVVSTWLGWFGAEYNGNLGAMNSALHECFLLLLNEWAALGNLLLPRDMLLKFASDAVVAANSTEKIPNRKFVTSWQISKTSSDFAPVKAQYLRLLQSIPEIHATQWKKNLGILELPEREEKSSVVAAVFEP